MSTSVKVHNPPKGFIEKIRWLGPGFLWMVSAAGSGELLFTPRVGALYGYALLWALLATVGLKWFINREIGRYAVCTGRSVIDGFAELPGPKNWAVYIILIPQLLVAVTGVAGLAASSASALVLVFPGDIKLWTIVAVVVSSALVMWGRFKIIERTATVLAIGLGASAIIAAISVFPPFSEFAVGIVPSAPPNVKYSEVLPWLGFMLTGAAGFIWYSYWVREKGYGIDASSNKSAAKNLNEQEIKKLEGWIRQMTADTTLGVVGTLIVTLSFLILGVELLRPKGLIPEENKVAEILAGMLSHVWGPVGFWFMITAVFVGFWDTVLSNQDGFGRMFAGGTRHLLGSGKSTKWLTEKFLRRIVVIVLVTIAPILVYLWIGEPVALLKIGGAIEAFDIPILVALMLYLNLKSLPPRLKPSKFSIVMTALAGLFFAGFAIVYLLQITGIWKFE